MATEIVLEQFRFLVGRDEFELFATRSKIAGFVMVREFGFKTPIVPLKDKDKVIYPKGLKGFRSYLKMAPREFLYLNSEAIKIAYSTLRQIYK